MNPITRIREMRDEHSSHKRPTSIIHLSGAYACFESSYAECTIMNVQMQFMRCLAGVVQLCMFHRQGKGMEVEGAQQNHTLL